MTWFLSRGYMVSLPVEQTTYDLVVESDEGLKRVQVRTSRGGQVVGLTRTQYGASKGTPSSGRYGSRPYRSGELDLFYIYCGDGSAYLIPLDAVLGMRCLSLAKYANYRLPSFDRSLP
ncbi:group I intron-associated PD-(D/E)XK endonuclease [Micromonospora sp. 4G55]|uniref:group I intron-associated PD-(D/E)XK endonuclease n=1 Tax=Micromonospora sp. 4G55 TaxID=2806102 RepID=UPI0035C703B5